MMNKLFIVILLSLVLFGCSEFGSNVITCTVTIFNNTPNEIHCSWDTLYLGMTLQPYETKSRTDKYYLQESSIYDPITSKQVDFKAYRTDLVGNEYNAKYYVYDNEITNIQLYGVSFD